MGNMASEMAARMREDGHNPETEMINPTAPLEDGAAGPGTERTQPAPQPQPSAETLSPETVADGSEPGPVPYSRFREVNEAYNNLRGFEPLMQYGYDPDSLGRLAQFEAAWVQDPSGTVAQLVDNLDLPDEVKTQIRDSLGAASDESQDGGGTPSTSTEQGSEEPPAWFKPYAERQAREDQAMADRRENAERQQALEQVVSHWTALDEKAGITVNEGVMLAMIASHAASGQYRTPQELAEAARAEYMSDREHAVGSTVVRPGDGIGPRSVPRSAAVPSAPVAFKDFKSATKAALGAFERGELPPITRGG